MKIKDIVKEKQPEVYKKLMKERKEPKKQEHLSFYNINRIMQKNPGVDETKCR
ncbi:MAG: hypothetical protein N2486_02035 [Caloramator sp.]|nr:hypothetical protein [Caloramator sp.]